MNILDLLLTLCVLGLIVTLLVLAVSSTAQPHTSGRPSRGGCPPLMNADSTGKYRTQDGSRDYAFRFHQTQDGSFRIYILDGPVYGTRDQDSHSTHRLHDSEGAFICWSSRIDSHEDAKRIAALWAESTEKYRKTGKRF